MVGDLAVTAGSLAVPLLINRKVNGAILDRYGDTTATRFARGLSTATIGSATGRLTAAGLRKYENMVRKKQGKPPIVEKPNDLRRQLHSNALTTGIGSTYIISRLHSPATAAGYVLGSTADSMIDVYKLYKAEKREKERLKRRKKL